MMLLLYLLFVLLPISSLTHKQHYSCRTQAPCGCSSQQAIVSKIVGGEIVEKQSWGWMVSLTYRSNHEHFCGGSILSSLWILTAAHCVSKLNKSSIIIRAGLTELNQNSQKHRVAKIFSHPHFDSDTYVNDIALIKLSSPLDMIDPDIAQICLPSHSQIGSISRSEYPPVNSRVIAIGWGQKEEYVRLTSRELQQVTLQTIASDSDSCSTLVSSRGKQFCAGVENGGKDTCQGDSGGPLMKFSSNKQWILAGVTSFGSGCGQSNSAGVYTRVAYYLDWINIITGLDAPIIAYDGPVTHKPVNSIYPDDESIANICSSYHSLRLFFIGMVIHLFLSQI